MKKKIVTLMLLFTMGVVFNGHTAETYSNAIENNAKSTYLNTVNIHFLLLSTPNIDSEYSLKCWLFKNWVKTQLRTIITDDEDRVDLYGDLAYDLCEIARDWGILDEIQDLLN